MSDSVQFGCMRCKRTKRSKKMVETAKKTMEDVFEAAWELLRAEAVDLNVEVPIEFKGKMLKWGAKYHIFEPDAAEEDVVADRNKHD